MISKMIHETVSGSFFPLNVSHPNSTPTMNTGSLLMNMNISFLSTIKVLPYARANHKTIAAAVKTYLLETLSNAL